MQTDQGISTNAKRFRKQSCIPEIFIENLKNFWLLPTFQNPMQKITVPHKVCSVQNTELTKIPYLSQTTTKNLHFHPYIHKSNTHQVVFILECIM